MLRFAVVMRPQRDCDFRGGARDAPTVVIETTLNGDVGALWEHLWDYFRLSTDLPSISGRARMP